MVLAWVVVVNVAFSLSCLSVFVIYSVSSIILPIFSAVSSVPSVAAAPVSSVTVVEWLVNEFVRIVEVVLLCNAGVELLKLLVVLVLNVLVDELSGLEFLIAHHAHEDRSRSHFLGFSLRIFLFHFD